jgi:hypothetical protein
MSARDGFGFGDKNLPVGPETGAVTGTYYNAPAKTLVVTIGKSRFSRSRKRIFVRKLEELRYREILSSENSSYFVKIAIAQDVGKMFAWRRYENEPNRSTVCAIRLPDGEESELPAPRDPAEARWGRWLGISDLLAASSDGKYVYIMAIYIPGRSSVPSAAVEHKLAKMSADTGELELIATCPGGS